MNKLRTKDDNNIAKRTLNNKVILGVKGSKANAAKSQKKWISSTYTGRPKSDKEHCEKGEHKRDQRSGGENKKGRGQMAGSLQN